LTRDALPSDTPARTATFAAKVLMEGFTMRSETPLWEKVYLDRYGRVYINAGKIIGHLGCGAFAFFDAAKLLPDYDKYRYENAVRDLTVYTKREQGQYELHAAAKKILRIIIGPAPDDPEYVKWWRGRLISVEQMKREGQPVEWAETPPVPLEPLEPEVKEEPPKSVKKPARKRAAKK
jgi:hypothetical protein